MTQPHRIGLSAARPALWLPGLLVAVALSACGGGAADTTAHDTTSAAASASETEAVQAALAAGGSDVAPQVNLAAAPDIRLLAAQGQTPDLMVDPESTQ